MVFQTISGEEGPLTQAPNFNFDPEVFVPPGPRTIPPMTYLSGFMGSGKSYAVENYIRESNEEFVVATQLTALSEQYEANLTDGVSIKALSLKSAPSGVKKSYAHYAGTCSNRVYALNQEVVLTITPDPRKILIIDEPMNIFSKYTISLKEDSFTSVEREAKARFLKCLNQQFSEVSDFYEIFSTPATIKNLQRESDSGSKASLDILSEVQRTVLERVVNSHYRVIVSKKEFHQFFDQAEGTNNLSFYVTAKPTLFSGWKSVLFVCANFEETLLNRIWGNDLNIACNEELAAKLRYADLTHKADCVNRGGLFHLSERILSKKLLKKVGTDHFLNKANEVIVQMYPTTDHIFCTNKDQNDFEWSSDRAIATRISPDPRGLNQYQDTNMAIHMAALNLDTYSIRFLSDFYGIDPDDVMRSTTWERTAQFLGRTSLRDPCSDEPIILIVGDQFAAKYIQELIGCAPSQLIDLEIPELRDKKPVSVKDRKANQRANDRLMALDSAPQYPDFSIVHYNDMYNRADYFVQTSPWIEYRKYLKHLSETYVRSVKLTGALWREGLFENGVCIATKSIILDIDKLGDCNIDTFSDWLQHHDISHLIHQSFSSRNNRQRIRVVIPLSEAVDDRNYKHIVRLLEDAISARFENIKLDAVSKSITVPFLTPSISIHDADIFIDGTVINELTGSPIFLDVRAYVKRHRGKDERQEAPLAVSEPRNLTERLPDVESIIRANEVPFGQPGGNDAFFQAGLDLVQAGYTFSETESALTTNRNRFGTGRNRDVNGAMKSFRKYHPTHPQA